MTAITMKNFMTALTTGELVINVKAETGEVTQVSKSIFDENGALISEVVEYAKAQITKIEDKNTKRKDGSKPTAKQIENEGIKSTILSLMEVGTTYTAKDIIGFEIEGVTTTQKVSALMKQLVTAGKVTATDVKPEGSKSKVKGYSLVAEATDEAVAESETEDEVTE